jgi:hypothetical protein
MEFASRLSNILNVFSHNLVNTFVESACWPDDLKQYELHSMDDWHFIDVPVYLNKTMYQEITYGENDALGIMVT